MSTSAKTHRMYEFVSSLPPELLSREKFKQSTTLRKLSSSTTPEAIKPSQPSVLLVFSFRASKEEISMQSNHMEPRCPKNSTSSSSYSKLRRANTSSKHEISFLLNGPKPSNCDPVRNDQLETTPRPQQESPAMRWREQQLWAVNEIRELTNPIPNSSENSTSSAAARVDAKKTCAQCGKRFTQSADLKKQ
ncbi:hypothetical protein BWQ96_02896 [Gracilariopsis chorda]|uniref:C2H2-type domain-containing protein n=1 Tax=Gracilariopsis chorda TaxID=448386 RepID=A0A2V3IZ01_9FLOR|nr:hypothetical protein BWQ96_02896 [Gracilariopsis chorda]|eukprot:PXF47283.1 hypothetical protein BWQ96_02896 [Gracilariopsis chorda]